MEQDKLHINYTADDIQRYLGSKMTPLEMNALEKAALDDPFLAEAIEGYQLVPQTDWKPALQSLKDSFAQKQGAAPAKVVGFAAKRYTWLKYAAAVLLLGGGIGTYFMLNKNSSTQDDKTVAAAEKTTPVTETQKTAAVADSAIIANTGKQAGDNAVRQTIIGDLKKDTQLIAFNNTGTEAKDLLNPGSMGGYKKSEITTPEKEKLQPFVTAPAAPAARLDDVAAAKDIAAEKSVAANATRSAEVTSDNFYKQEAILSNTQNQARAANKAQELNRRFTAQVVDRHNNPLPFANINVKNEGFGTYADVKGNVRLVSTDSVIPVEIRSLGFKTQTIVLRSNQQQNRVVLQEDESVAYQQNTQARKSKATNVMSRRAMLERDSTLDAEPADGWDNYATYVGNNLEIPDNILSKNLHGTVEVSFDVTSNGTVANVKVDKSLCDDCDEMARRIVEQGPQWKIKKGRRAKARVKVNF
jgi:TonB family protein